MATQIQRTTRFVSGAYSGLLEAVGRLTVLVLLSLAMLGVAIADDADTDPPGRVARLSYAAGSVSLQPAGVDDWTAATVNRPLTTGDKLWTEQGSRAELDIGAAVIRLGNATGFSFLSLDDDTAQMQVTAGTVLVHVRELLDGQTYEIDTPNLAVLLESPGQYRVDVNDTGDTTVVRVSDGQAEVSANDQTTPITNQQMVTFTGTNQLSMYAATLGAPDGLDDWSLERDRRSEQAQSRQYVPEDMAGTEDLDVSGQWQDTPDYGYVWTPNAVAVGWAPYSVGHWAWVGPWGWTWVDDASWGFAPFHYGRWARWHDSWCWVPGPRHVRPVYAPAMVAWVGGGRGGPSVGGGVGWFPLGPREVYVPGYHVSDRYVRSVNISNTTISNHTYITNVYQNRVNNIRYANSGIPGAVTAVPRNVFTSAQPVGGHRMHWPANEGGRFSPSGAPPAIAPDRQSVLGASSGRSVHRPPPRLLNRQVVARTAPPAAPVSFDREQAAIRANGGRPLGRGDIARLQPSAPAAQVRLVTPTSGARHGPGINRPALPAQEGGRAGGFERPGQSAPNQPSQPNQEGRGPVRQRPGEVAAPAAPAAGADSRELTERARALQNSTLPRARGPGINRPGGMRNENGGAQEPGGSTFESGARDNDRSRNFQSPPPVQQQAPPQQQLPAQQQRVPSREPAQDRPERSFSTDRPPSAAQPDRFEQARPPVNSFTRPQPESRQPENRQPENPRFENRQPENRQFEDRRPAPQPMQPAPSAPQVHTFAPPPPPARVVPPPIPAPRPVPPPPPAPVHVAPAAPPPQQHSPPPANQERIPQRGVRGDQPK